MKPVKYPVHGDWMTIREIAERFGVTPMAIYDYRRRHRAPDGSPLPMQDMYDRYASLPRRAADGTREKHYFCAGRWQTLREAAETLGVKKRDLDNASRLYGCSMEAAYRIVEARLAYRAQIDAIMAEMQILEILGGERHD